MTLLRIAGLDQDDALRAALTEHFDITTLTQPQIAAYAALAGDAALAATGADAARAAAFRTGRQFIDLLAAAPHRLTRRATDGTAAPAGATALFDRVQPQAVRRVRIC